MEKQYEQAIEVYAQNSERSMQLEKIPGLLRINKVKPKTSKENVRVTQDHKSVGGKRYCTKGCKKKKKKRESKKQKTTKNNKSRSVFSINASLTVCMGELLARQKNQENVQSATVY